MNQVSLISAVSRFADAHANGDGIAATPVDGLTLIRASSPSALQYAISNPMVVLVVQGAKRVSLNGVPYDFAAGESLFITADVPTVSQITKASVSTPYYSLVVDLDPALIAELCGEMDARAGAGSVPVAVGETTAEVADAALRLVNLLDRPSALPILSRQVLREMHYWLLAGRHGASIRRLGWPDSSVERIGRAVAHLRQHFASSIRVEDLAGLAGMSLSSFHHHFRDVTSLSPLQFQKQLRLIEARRLMLAEGQMASQAAFAVGYESVPQFTREYGRLFGMPPGQDMREARRAPLVAA
jgi:AraC-type DNA-binding domain-containing proteins